MFYYGHANTKRAESLFKTLFDAEPFFFPLFLCLLTAVVKMNFWCTTTKVFFLCDPIELIEFFTTWAFAKQSYSRAILSTQY